jgi:anti-anti-sigma factor
MPCTVTHVNSIPIIEVRGRLDSVTAEVVAEELFQAVDQAEYCLVVDLGEVTFISSAGLRALLLAARPLRARGGHLVLSRLRPQVREVFDIVGLSQLFPVYESAQAAADGMAVAAAEARLLAVGR